MNIEQTFQDSSSRSMNFPMSSQLTVKIDGPPDIVLGLQSAIRQYIETYRNKDKGENWRES